MSPPPPDEAETGWTRLAAVWEAATARVEPGDPIPPAPPELAEWGSNTMMVASFGAIYTGLREWRTQAAGPPIAIPPGLGPQDAAKAVSAAQMGRLAKAGAAATGGAARAGGLAGLFWALQLGAGIARGVRSPIADTAAAASATGALFGAMLPGLSPALRARSALLGAALGAAVAVPASLAQQAVAGLLPEGDPARARVAAGAPAGMPAAAAAAAAPSPEAAAGAGVSRPGAWRGGPSTVAADVAAHLEAGLSQRR